MGAWDHIPTSRKQGGENQRFCCFHLRSEDRNEFSWYSNTTAGQPWAALALEGWPQASPDPGGLAAGQPWPWRAGRRPALALQGWPQASPGLHWPCRAGRRPALQGPGFHCVHAGWAMGLWGVCVGVVHSCACVVVVYGWCVVVRVSLRHVGGVGSSGRVLGVWGYYLLDGGGRSLPPLSRYEVICYVSVIFRCSRCGLQAFRRLNR